MPRKKAPAKKKYSEKTITYRLPANVVEALENVMQDEVVKTMSKAISQCILNHMAFRQRIKELQQQLSDAKNEAWNNKAKSENFVYAIKALMEMEPTEAHGEADEDFDDDM